MHPSTSPSRIAAWSLLFIASLFYAYQYILRVMPNIMLSDITEQFNMGAATFGQFSGIYYIGYSLMHLPVGIMLDRYGPKKVMSGAILLSVAGLTPLIFASHWAYPIAGRLLIGVGSSAAILGVFKIIRMSFEEKLFPKMLSIAVTIGHTISETTVADNLTVTGNISVTGTGLFSTGKAIAMAMVFGG